MRTAPVMTAMLAATSIVTTACPNDPRPLDGTTGNHETSTTGAEPAPTGTDTTHSATTGGVLETTGDPGESSSGSFGTTDATGVLTSSWEGTAADESASDDTAPSSSTDPLVDCPPPTTLQLEILPVKQFAFAWPPSPGATHYQIHERATPDAAFMQIGADVVGTEASRFVPLHLRSSASYLVRACNECGCADSPPVDVDDSLASAVGYFKASNNKAYQYYGESVALSADGTTMVVGSPFEDGAATGVNGDQTNQSVIDSGAAYVYVAVNGEWKQQAYIKASNTGGDDRFGYSVSLSADGNTLVVGANFEDSGATGVNGNQGDGSSNAGAVYVYRRDGDVWLQQAYLKASNARSGAAFGISVAVAGDGDTLVVGSENESSGVTGINGNQSDTSAGDAGAVYVFARKAGTWSQQAYVKASNTQAGDLFGHSVALSFDGDTLAASAIYEDSSATGVNGIQSDNSAGKAGAVYVYTRVDAVWTQQAYVKASNAASADEFGGMIDLSDDGDTLAVGAAFDNSAATGIDGNQFDDSLGGAGAAYVFARSNEVWEQQAYIKATNTGATDHFGAAVALSGEGNMLVASAVFEDSNAVGVDGDPNNNGAVDSGALYVYVRDGQVWSPRSYLKAPNTGADDRHGDSLALSHDGTTLVVGTNLEDSAAQGLGGDQSDNSAIWSGAVYVY